MFAGTEAEDARLCLSMHFGLLGAILVKSQWPTARQCWSEIQTERSECSSEEKKGWTRNSNCLRADKFPSKLFRVPTCVLGKRGNVL